MVKRIGKYVILAFCLLFLALTGAGVWFWHTESGARTLLNAISATTPLTIEVDSLSGRLADELSLQGVRLQWPGGEAATSSLFLNWHPWQLLRGRLALQKLSLGEVAIHIHPAPETAPSSDVTLQFQWPQIPPLAQRFSATLESLHLAGATIHRADAETLRLGAVALRLDWQDGRLRCSKIIAQTPYGRFSGEMAAGLVTPSLSGRVHGELSENQSIDLNLDLSAGPETQILAGRTDFDFHSEQTGTLRLTASLGLAANSAELRDLRITRSTAGGEVRGLIRYRFSDAARPLTLMLRLADLDLTPETGIVTALSGLLSIEGSPAAYKGSFELQNPGKGWRNLALSGALAGNRHTLTLTDLDGRLLHGKIAGRLQLDWSDTITLSTALQGEGLNPGLLSPPLSGALNLDLSSTMRLPPAAPLQLDLSARLRESRLRGHPLRGEIDARLEDNDLRLRRLELHGNGIAVTAKGRWRERLDFSLAVAHLEELLPEARGDAQAAGWLRWQDGELTGSLEGGGRALAYGDMSLDRAQISLQRPDRRSSISLRTELETIRYKEKKLTRLELWGEGSPAAHRLRLKMVWPQGESRIAGEGGYQKRSWSGKILQLQGEDKEQGAWRLAAPATLIATADTLRFSPIEISSERGERLEVAGELDHDSGKGEIIAQWDDLILDRANPWLSGLRLQGGSSGTLQGRWGGDTPLRLHGKIVAAGRLERGEIALEAQRLAADLAWDEEGLRLTGEVVLVDGGRFTGELASPEGGRLALPGRLTVQLEWDGLDLEHAAPWLPPEVTADGSLSGGLRAELYPGGSLDISGNAAIEDGIVTWKQKKGRMVVPLRSAALDWRWQQQDLHVNLALVLADYGRITGNVRLPIPAILPAAIDPEGKLSGEIEGRLQEQGLLAALLPGVLRESHGDVQLDLRIGGSWQNPALNGKLGVSGAGAYLPQAGIDVHDLNIQADFSGDRLHIATIEAASGDGKLSGEGVVLLKNWLPEDFRISLSGERFLAVNLPELRLVATPALTLSGSGDKLKLRGEIKLPELLVRGRQTPAPLRQHADVVILDREEQPSPAPSLALDLELRLVLGERVLVNYGGIDARLTGAVLLSARQLDEIKGRGEIRVTEGSYAAYGMRLDVDRGTLLFAGGPVDQPTLDIVATRKSGEVKAGVRVTGTPRSPLVKLYSEPLMPDTDILSYIVFGRPMGSDTGQADLLLVAAGALLRKGESTVLQDRLRRRVGLDTLDIQAGNGDVTTSMITVGKYLNPKLYISLGHALFTGSNVVGLRYSLAERWQAESTVGEESGVDLYYTIEFQ